LLETVFVYGIWAIDSQRKPDRYDGVSQGCDAFFVTRAKDNINYRRLYSHPKDKTKGTVYNQTILLNNYYTSKYYPKKLRVIKYHDEETGKLFVF